MVETFWGHQIAPKPLYDDFTKYCTNNPLDIYTPRCLQATGAMLDTLGKLNAYALDYPICTAEDSESKLKKQGRAQRMWLMSRLLATQGFSEQQIKTMGKCHSRACWGLQIIFLWCLIQNSLRPQIVAIIGFSATEEDYEPCEDNYATIYLNRADVKEAIHVKSNIKWEQCSYTLNYSNTDGQLDMVPYYNYLIDGGYGLKILVYSGDDDSVCATVGTQDWVSFFVYIQVFKLFKAISSIIVCRSGQWATALFQDLNGNNKS